MRNTPITLGLIASLGEHVVANKQKRNLKVSDQEYRHTFLINGTLYLLIRTYFGWLNTSKNYNFLVVTTVNVRKVGKWQ